MASGLPPVNVGISSHKKRRIARKLVLYARYLRIKELAQSLDKELAVDESIQGYALYRRRCRKYYRFLKDARLFLGLVRTPGKAGKSPFLDGKYWTKETLQQLIQKPWAPLADHQD